MNKFFANKRQASLLGPIPKSLSILCWLSGILVLSFIILSVILVKIPRELRTSAIFSNGMAVVYANELNHIYSGYPVKVESPVSPKTAAKITKISYNTSTHKYELTIKFNSPDYKNKDCIFAGTVIIKQQNYPVWKIIVKQLSPIKYE